MLATSILPSLHTVSSQEKHTFAIANCSMIADTFSSLSPAKATVQWGNCRGVSCTAKRRLPTSHAHAPTRKATATVRSPNASRVEVSLEQLTATAEMNPVHLAVRQALCAVGKVFPLVACSLIQLVNNLSHVQNGCTYCMNVPT